MSIYYFDTSAVLKRVLRESYSESFREFLSLRTQAQDPCVSSALLWVEVSRALLRWNPQTAARQGDLALSGIAKFPLTDKTYDRAMNVGAGQLRPLDALPLAAAVQVGAQFLVTYDGRLAESATAV
ncbi:MAG: type II toxin-antitoxin system VapC family toxin, partial [Angustibacter sp.]